MEKYKNLVFVLALAILLGGANVYADNNNPNIGNKPVPPAWRTENKEKRIELRQEWREHRAEVLSEMKEKKIEWRGEMKQNLGDKKKLARTRISVGMMQRAENLSNIADRIEARIEKIEADGGDTNGAEDKVADAQEKLDTLMDKIADLKELATQDDANLEDIKSKIAEIKTLFKEVHTLLSEAVQALKAVDTEEDNEDEE